MKDAWTLAGIGHHVRRLTYQRGAMTTTVSPVLTVANVCRILGKSQRQVYRYLSAGRLQPCAQVLGQWLIANAEVDRFVATQVPAALRRFFWDVPVSSLSVDRHRDFILARLLEEGDRQALRWLFRVYPRDCVASFLKGRGAAALSRRAWHFWASQVGLHGPSQGARAWRRRGRRWGGLR